MSDIQKAKDNYYKSRYESNPDHGAHPADIYIEELEKMNEEMGECLISIQEGKQPYENESGVIKISLQKFPNIKKIIEKHEGKPIKEILKDEML